MSSVLCKFLRGQEGQDLVEYALILAFIALAGAAAYLGIGSSTKVIWSAVNDQLAAPASGS